MTWWFKRKDCIVFVYRGPIVFAYSHYEKFYAAKPANLR